MARAEIPIKHKENIAFSWTCDTHGNEKYESSNKSLYKSRKFFENRLTKGRRLCPQIPEFSNPITLGRHCIVRLDISLEQIVANRKYHSVTSKEL